MADESQSLILIGLLIVLMLTSVGAMFNLGQEIPGGGFSLPLSGSVSSIMFSVIARFIVAPVLFIICGWIIINLIREGIG